MVQTFKDLPKGAFPDHFKHFKPVGNVVMQYLEDQNKNTVNIRSDFDVIKTNKLHHIKTD